MDAYFDRHDKDQNARIFGNDKDPSRGYMAWLNWGGDSGERWAEKKKASMRDNPQYRRNFFGLFGSSPTYYVVETTRDIMPTQFSDEHDYFDYVQKYKRFDLKDAIRAARRMRDQYLQERRGGEILFVVEKKGPNISFIDYETLEPKSFEDLKIEFRSLR